MHPISSALLAFITCRIGLVIVSGSIVRVASSTDSHSVPVSTEPCACAILAATDDLTRCSFSWEDKMAGEESPAVSFAERTCRCYFCAFAALLELIFGEHLTPFTVMQSGFGRICSKVLYYDRRSGATEECVLPGSHPAGSHKMVFLIQCPMFMRTSIPSSHK